MNDNDAIREAEGLRDYIRKGFLYVPKHADNELCYLMTDTGERRTLSEALYLIAGRIDKHADLKGKAITSRQYLLIIENARTRGDLVENREAILSKLVEREKELEKCRGDNAKLSAEITALRGKYVQK